MLKGLRPHSPSLLMDNHPPKIEWGPMGVTKPHLSKSPGSFFILKWEPSRADKHNGSFNLIWASLIQHHGCVWLPNGLTSSSLTWISANKQAISIKLTSNNSYFIWAKLLKTLCVKCYYYNSLHIPSSVFSVSAAGILNSCCICVFFPFKIQSLKSGAIASILHTI